MLRALIPSSPGPDVVVVHPGGDVGGLRLAPRDHRDPAAGEAPLLPPFGEDVAPGFVPHVDAEGPPHDRFKRLDGGLLVDGRCSVLDLVVCPPVGAGRWSKQDVSGRPAAGHHHHLRSSPLLLRGVERDAVGGGGSQVERVGPVAGDDPAHVELGPGAARQGAEIVENPARAGRSVRPRDGALRPGRSRGIDGGTIGGGAAHPEAQLGRPHRAVHTLDPESEVALYQRGAVDLEGLGLPVVAVGVGRHHMGVGLGTEDERDRLGGGGAKRTGHGGQHGQAAMAAKRRRAAGRPGRRGARARDIKGHLES